MRRLAPIVLVLLAGCSSPTEKRRQVSAERAPLLPEPESDEAAMIALRRGELVEVGRTLPPIEWKGAVDGIALPRSGPLVEAKRSAGETAMFLFASDVGGEVTVPSARWLCEKMAAAPACPGRLRRALLDGGLLLASEPCGVGPCQIAVAQDGKVQSATLDGMGEVAPLTANGLPFALAWSRWVKAPNWTGGSITVYRLAPRLERVFVIPNDEIDARKSPVIQRHGLLSLDGDHLVFRGTRIEVATDGKQLSEKVIGENYLLPKK
jgi:hypothetical protein